MKGFCLSIFSLYFWILTSLSGSLICLNVTLGMLMYMFIAA